MVSKLGQRIACYLVLVSALTIVLVSFLINLALDNQFSEYLQTVEADRHAQIIGTIDSLYQEAKDWQMVAHQIESLGLMTGQIIRIIDESDTVILDSSRARWGARQHSGATNGFQSTGVIGTNNQTATVVITSLGRQRDVYTPRDMAFRDTVYRSIRTAALLATLFALAISLFVSKRLVKPLSELIVAVRSMGQGNLNQQVKVIGNDELSGLASAFNEMSSNLQQLEHLRKKLTSDVAHELRTPVANVQAYVEGMHDGVIPTSKEKLFLVKEEIDRLTQLIEDLQQLAKAEAPLRTKKRINLGELVTSLVNRLSPMFHAEEIELKCHVEDTVYTRGDERALERAIRNIIINGLQYTPKNGSVKINVTDNNQESLITISDTGIGIDEKELPFIFERFFRADASRSRKTGGTGIGLAITAEIIQSHGGSVKATSVNNKGTTFTIRLPQN